MCGRTPAQPWNSSTAGRGSSSRGPKAWTEGASMSQRLATVSSGHSISARRGLAAAAGAAGSPLSRPQMKFTKSSAAPARGRDS